MVCGLMRLHEWMDYEKNLWWKEVGLNAPNVITILGSIVNIIGKGGGVST